MSKDEIWGELWRTVWSTATSAFHHRGPPNSISEVAPLSEFPEERVCSVMFELFAPCGPVTRREGDDLGLPSSWLTDLWEAAEHSRQAAEVLGSWPCHLLAVRLWAVLPTSLCCLRILVSKRATPMASLW